MSNSRKSCSGGIDAAKESAYRYLSYRLRTIREMERKLAEKGYICEVSQTVISFLKERGLLDDEAFTLMWIRNRMTERPSGRYRVFQELLQKGIDREVIERHLELISEETEEKMAAALVHRKCSRSSPDYGKLWNYLMRRGFNTETVKKVLSEFARRQDG